MRNQLTVGIKIANDVLNEVQASNGYDMRDLEQLRGYAYALNIDVDLRDSSIENIVGNVQELRNRLEKLM